MQNVQKKIVRVDETISTYTHLKLDKSQMNSRTIWIIDDQIFNKTFFSLEQYLYSDNTM